MLFYDCYEKEVLSFFSRFSHLHRRLIRLAISDRVILTVCCSFPFVVVTSTSKPRARLREKQREREIDLQSAMRAREKKKKNIIVTANPIISCAFSFSFSRRCFDVCVDWHVKVFLSRCSSNVHRIEPIITQGKCYHNERTPMYGQ